MLTAEVLCATQLVAPCPDGIPQFAYPRPTRVRLHLPPAQRTMPDPCRGVPANPWCPNARTSPNGASPEIESISTFSIAESCLVICAPRVPRFLL